MVGTSTTHNAMEPTHTHNMSYVHVQKGICVLCISSECELCVLCIL